LEDIMISLARILLCAWALWWNLSTTGWIVMDAYETKAECDKHKTLGALCLPDTVKP
jgi:hypothetical protein